MTTKSDFPPETILPPELMEALEHSAALAAGRLVLVAEDHPFNRKLVRRQLRTLGYFCDTLADGLEALTAFQRTRYGLLLTDCQMPRMDGYALAAALRIGEGTAAGRLPIIAITVGAGAEEIARCRAAGIDDFLEKPVDLEALQACLQRWLPKPASETEAGAVLQDAAATEIAPAKASPPNIDLTSMKRLYGGSESLKFVLSSFVAIIREDLRDLQPLLLQRKELPLRRWIHRFRGCVGVLGQRALQERIDQFLHHLDTGCPAKLQHEGLALSAYVSDFLLQLEQIIKEQ